MVFAAHDAAFHYWGRVQRQGIYDNLKTCVSTRCSMAGAAFQSPLPRSDEPLCDRTGSLYAGFGLGKPRCQEIVVA